VRRRLSLAFAAVGAALVLVLGLASGAPARTGGQAKLPPLTAAEKAAMTITSVDVKAADNLGVFVTATFKGNFQAAMGKGHLAHAAAALLLLPKPGKALSAGLVTVGAGKIGKLYRQTKSTNVGSFRNGNKLTFFVLGPGFANVQSVVAETVQSVAGLGPPLSTSAVATDVPPFSGPRQWDKFVTLNPIDKRVQTADVSGLSCPQLQALLASINDDFRDPYFPANVSGEVTVALQAFKQTVTGLLAKCPPPAPALAATFAWSFFSSNEVAGTGQFTGPATTLSSVRVVLPAGFAITNHLCPGQLPIASISGGTISCGGGTLSTGQTFTLNVQTSPFPTPGMGGELFGVEGNGTTDGPFTITGP
jgi:hypothetical protein